METRYGESGGGVAGGKAYGLADHGIAGKEFPAGGRAAKEVSNSNGWEGRGLMIDPRFRRPAVLRALYANMSGGGKGARRAEDPGTGKD